MTWSTGLWSDPRIVNDDRIAHDSHRVRRVAERLHSSESMQSTAKPPKQQ